MSKEIVFYLRLARLARSGLFAGRSVVPGLADAIFREAQNPMSFDLPVSVSST